MVLLPLGAALPVGTLVFALTLFSQCAHGAVYSHTLGKWDFDNDLEGWADSTFEEMNSEVHVRGGELFGSVHGPRPHFDSPRLNLFLDGTDHWIVVRMSYSGTSGSTGGVVLRTKSMSMSSPNLDMHDDKTESREKAWAWEEDDADIDSVAWDWNKDGQFVEFDEPFSGDGKHRIYHARVWKRAKGTLQQFRVIPSVLSEADDGKHNFRIDWIRVVKAPTLRKLEGCIDKYFDSEHLGFGPSQAFGTMTATRTEDGAYVHRGTGGGFASISASPFSVNGNGHIVGRTVFNRMDEKPYATTYNCLRSGGERLRITGSNLGSFDASNPVDRPTVTISGELCTNVSIVVPQKVIECTTPVCRGCSSRENSDRLDVKVAHADLPGVYGLAKYFSYAVRPPRIAQPTVSNIASHSVTLNWKAPVDFWDALTITGYVIQRREMGRGKYGANVVVGNVTTTTLIGLAADTKYEFRIAGLVEDQRKGRMIDSEMSYDWQQLDLYGRRKALRGAVKGTYSYPTQAVLTLRHDFHFTVFDANATLNHLAINKGPNQTTRDPLRVEGGEGHYGLRLVGDASIENCNVSHACCDLAQDGECVLMCTGIETTNARYLNGVTDRKVATNQHNNGVFIGAPSDVFKTYMDVYEVKSKCGGALRLTGSHARQTGAAWYPRKMNVREGFDTTFTFHLSSPSLTCDVMDDVDTNCRSRGADGFAFVIQNEDGMALGRGGMSLGYGGIGNGMAVEFDTYFNYELLDPYENHISVMSNGWRKDLTSNHSTELGGAVDPPDLTNMVHTARIVYSPEFDMSALDSPNFVVTGHTTHFFTNAQYPDGGMADFGTGVGTMSVYLNDMHTPLFILPIRLDTLLRLDSGRAWVGFTAATGDSRWQTQDILSWSFASARKDPPFTPPQIVDGTEAHRCVADSPNECVHK